MFFEISQNSHENTCARGLRPATLLKKETLTQVFFCEFPNSMTQRGEKLDSPVLSLGDFWMVWICRGILCFHSYFSCLETTLITEQLDENDFRRYIFSPESIIPEVMIHRYDHSYVQSSLSTITSQLDNSIWKTPYNWIFYGHRCQACTKTFNLLLYASLSLKQA